MQVLQSIVFLFLEEVKPLILNPFKMDSSVLTVIKEGIWDFPKSPWNPELIPSF